jgi:hypothetical protein
MTRTPRTPLHALTTNLRTRIPAGLSRKTVASAGAGLALAGVTGATVAAGFAGQPAPAASAQHSVTRDASAASRDAGGASHGVSTAPVKPVNHTADKHTADKKTAPTKHAAPATHAAPAGHAAKHAPTTHHAKTWAAVSRIVAGRTYPTADHGALPAQDQLTPVGTSGPQTWLPITPARWDNAKTIVREAIKKHMGLRAAVIAVATSMQESTLLNLNYGDRDSLGLFQQRPSCGWGTPAQIQHPAHAADAFLKALHGYQSSDPSWAHQPLWQAAQGVQGSAFPSAYA